VHGVRLKREIMVAQENSSGGGITDTNDFTGFDMYRRSSTGHRVKLNRQLISSVSPFRSLRKSSRS